MSKFNTPKAAAPTQDGSGMLRNEPIKTPPTEANPMKSSVDTSRMRASPSLQGADLIPSNWDIQPNGDGITAINNLTRKTFSGTMKEFNNLLNGRE